MLSQKATKKIFRQSITQLTNAFSVLCIQHYLCVLVIVLTMTQGNGNNRKQQLEKVSFSVAFTAFSKRRVNPLLHNNAFSRL